MVEFDDLFEPSPVDGRASLVDFIDRQALQIACDCVGDYTQARLPGGDAQLMAAAALRAGMEKAIWESFPRVLAMLSELVAGALPPFAGDWRTQQQAVIAVAAEAFDRHEGPPSFDGADWRAAREGMLRVLADVGDDPPRPLDAVVEAFAVTVLAVMPLHVDLGRDDYPMLCALLRAKLAAACDAFERDANRPALAEALSAPGHGEPAPTA